MEVKGHLGQHVKLCKPCKHDIYMFRYIFRWNRVENKTMWVESNELNLIPVASFCNRFAYNICISMYVCMFVWVYACMRVYLGGCMRVCMCVCFYVCLYL